MPNPHSSKLKTSVFIYLYSVIIALIWTVVVAVSLLWNISRERTDTEELAMMEARLHFNKDQALRMWGASHGGVYVPPSEKSPPNPYLDHVSERDIKTESGKELTLVNPAYMIRQLMGFYSDMYGVEGHLTSLKVLNPRNEPDEWEQEALHSFESGIEEAATFIKKDNEKYLRYMRPLLTEKECLECHEFQGYKEGDIRGGISVTVPFRTYMGIERKSVYIIKLTHVVTWMLGMAVIGIVSYRSRNRMMERELAEEQLEYQAYYDQLTSLPNRTLFLKYLKRETDQAKEESNYLFAVLYLDLDRFKVINDSLGHVTGNRLLVAVAERLKICIRPQDTVARFGGDEFAILLMQCSNVIDATALADRIQLKLMVPFKLGDHEVFTSASIGIALSVTGYQKAEDILRDADAAMYRAKAHGRSRYELFDINMYTSAMQLLELESDLRRTVEQEKFMVYYQPVVSLESGKINGAEALIRWNHPERGLIPPMEFIHIAEETGLISTIGEWVLETACAQNKVWRDAGHRDLTIKVNFSACQFHHDNILELIKKVLRKIGTSAEILDIEVTESIATEGNSITVLRELSDMGVKISIDDFGTGYSSLGLLKRLPINTIKIDKSFIFDITIDANARAIVKAIISMAHNLKMKALAEGVETGEQLSFLKSNHCDEIQGFFFSKPVNAEEFTQLLETGFEI